MYKALVMVVGLNPSNGKKLILKVFCLFFNLLKYLHYAMALKMIGVQ